MVRSDLQQQMQRQPQKQQQRQQRPRQVADRRRGNRPEDAGGSNQGRAQCTTIEQWSKNPSWQNLERGLCPNLDSRNIYDSLR